MTNEPLARNIIKSVFRVFLVLLVWIEIDLLSRLMFGIDLSFVRIPLGSLHGVGRWVPWGSMAALLVWLVQLMLVAYILRKFDLVSETSFDEQKAVYDFNEASRVQKDRYEWSLPGQERISVDQKVGEIAFELGPNDEQVHSKDKIVQGGFIKYFFTPENPLVVAALGGMDALLSGLLRAIALDVLDREVQRFDYKEVMDEAGSGRFGPALKCAMGKITPTQEERRHVAKFRGLKDHARRAKTTMELYGVSIMRVTAHLNENEVVAEAAQEAKKAKELVGVAKELAAAEKKRADGIRASAANMLGITQSKFADLPVAERLEAIRVLGGDSTSTTEHKTFGLTPDTTDALTTGVAGMLAGIADARRHTDDSKDNS